MPFYDFSGSEATTRARAKIIKAKLAKLGIDPRCNKYATLFYRWMAQ